MADFIAHHLFGKDALGIFPSPAQLAAANRPACFHWGCQGPDLFFFRRIACGSPLRMVGKQMHQEKTSELFYALARAVNLLTGTANEIATAYFYGFLCHYALDSELHPYVYCRQEQICSVDPRLHRATVHCQIESDIDYALYRQCIGGVVTDFDPRERYMLSDEEQAVLSVLLHVVLAHVYDRLLPIAEIRACLYSMLRWQCFLYSRSEFIYRRALHIERVLGRGRLLSAHMKLEAPEWDVLNTERTPWCNLWQPDQERTESVPELFELARVRAATLAGQYAALLSGGFLIRYEFAVPFDNGNLRCG